MISKIRVFIVAILVAASSSAFAYDPASFHNVEPVPKKNYDSLFAEATPIGQSPAGEKLISECIKAYGGLEKLSGIKSIRTKWRMAPMMASDTVDVIKLMAAGLKYRVSIIKPAGRAERVLNGNQAWAVTPDTTILAQGQRYKSELFSYLTMGMPQNMRLENFTDTRYGTRDNDSLAYIYLLKPDSMIYVVGIDPNSHLMMKVEGAIISDTSSYHFANILSDHKVVDGYLIHHALINVSMGLEVGHSVLTEVTVNPETDDGDFRPVKHED
ncbi:MAG: hypothetical protein V3T31_09375 [candidate division Zixibacteria bacterium]